MTNNREMRPPRRDVNGILLLDKPEGVSSNKALQIVKRHFRARKAGHTGSLDVLATGLLPICFGEATKVCAFLLDADKTYRCEIQLGSVTSTGDREGEIVSRADNVDVNRRQVEAALAQFIGSIEQVPPMHSALKRNGQRLYKLAHRGIEVPREARRVTVYAIELISLREDVIEVDVTCSKGTYIRTLAQDIGEVLGCGAHVASLRRLRAGPFSLDDSATVEDIEGKANMPHGDDVLDRCLIPLDLALVDLPTVTLNEDCSHYLKQGQAVRVADAPADGMVRIYDNDTLFLGVGVITNDGRVAPRRLMR